MKELIRKADAILEKYSKVMLIVIFICGLLLYGLVASRMTGPGFFNVDEELYQSMAKSFFYEGHFAKNYNILSYNCVIYSILISIAYFFYSAENIIFIMRFIGVIVMMTSVFPIYLLSKEVLKSKSKAILISAFSILIPEFMLTIYLVQEVLCYPVFLWIAYLVYLKVTREKSKIIDMSLIALLALIFFIKSYAIVFAGAYFGTLCLIELKNKNYKKLGSYIAQGLSCLVIILIGIFLIRAVNGEGVNHYSNQISQIFPLDLNKIIAFFYGNFYYSVLFLYCIGFLPVLIPLFKFKSYDEKDRKFIMFLLLSALFTIIEAATIVFIPEEREKLYPAKFCYRYLAPIFVPLLIMFLKCKKENVKISKGMIGVYLIALLYLGWYYLGGEDWVTAIDASVLFVIQMLCEIIHLRRLKVLGVVFAVLVVIGMILVNKKEKLQKIYMVFLVIGCIIIFPMHYRQHSRYLNTGRMGVMLKPDFVTTSEYIGREYDKVYLIVDEEELSFCMRSFFAYSKSDFELIQQFEGDRNIEVNNRKIALIVADNFKGNIEGATKVDLDTNYIHVYVVEENQKELNVKF